MLKSTSSAAAALSCMVLLAWPASAATANTPQTENEKPTKEPEVRKLDAKSRMAVRERKLGLTRVYSSATEYSYKLPQSVQTPKQLTRGALTWRYVGQASFSDEPETRPQAGRYVVPSRVPGPRSVNEYFGVGRAEAVDLYGRLWRLASVDVEVMKQEIQKYDREVFEMFGRAEVPQEQIQPVVDYYYPEDAGQAFDEQNTSWLRCYCTNEPGYVAWDHSSDDLDKVDDPMNDRNKKVIWLASGSGSGTLVRSDWALTAAHLVSDNSGNKLNANSLDWCSMENLDENTSAGDQAICQTAIWVALAPGWSGGTDPTNDYAVVEFPASFGVGWFGISQAPDSTIKSHPDRVRGYQRKKWGCSTNSVTRNSKTTNDNWEGRHLYGAQGDIQSTPGTRVKWDSSVALGVSGGPHYYCPNGGCVNGHYLTGVQATISVNTCSGLINYTTCAGNSCLGGYSSGPKGSAIRTWVLNNTP